MVEGDDLEEVAWAFHPDRRTWVEHGFADLREALPWRDAGFSAYVAAGWRDAGVNVEDASAWQEAGVMTIFGLREWSSAWKEHGLGEFTVQDASAWTGTGIGKLSCAAHAARGDQPSEAVEQWSACGASVDTMKQMTGTGMLPEDFQRDILNRGQ